MELSERNQNLTRRRESQRNVGNGDETTWRFPLHLPNFSAATHLLWPQAICLQPHANALLSTYSVVSCVRPVGPFASFLCSALLVSSLFSETFFRSRKGTYSDSCSERKQDPFIKKKKKTRPRPLDWFIAKVGLPLPFQFNPMPGSQATPWSLDSTRAQL